MRPRSGCNGERKNWRGAGEVRAGHVMGPLMTILITGAFGFVGTNLSAYLAERGHELWALDVAPSDKGQEAIGNKQETMGSGLGAIGNENVSRQDAKAQRGGGANAQRSTLNVQRSSFGRGAYVRCYGWEELENIPWGEVDAVIHLAGKAHNTRNASDPQSYFDVNVGLTKKVIEKFSRQDAKTQRTFILFSSVKAVADRAEGVLTEEAAPDPQTPYGQSKLEAEKAVLKVGEAGSTAPIGAGSKRFNEPSGSATVEPLNQAAGRLNVYILRPCMIHGPGNKGNLNLLYGMVSKGLPWPLGAFENQRSFASIGNVCAVVAGLLAGHAEPGVYQVADDEALSTDQLVRLMAEVMGRRARVWRIPPGLMRSAARLGDLLHLPLNSERLRKLTESYVVSNAKIKAALGWEAMPLRAEEGMRTTLKSFCTCIENWE